MRTMAARIDDLLNPIVVKELRQAVQGRFVSVVFLLFLAVQLVVMGGTVFMSGIADQTQSLDYEAGMNAFAWLQGILLGTTILFVPVYTGVRLAAERSDENVDLMFVTTLRPHAIITGKLAAATIITLMIFSACAPFMTFTYLLRGIDLHIIFLTILLDFFIVLTCVQMFILLAVVSSNRIAKIMIGILGLIILFFAMIYGLAGSVALVYFGVPPDTNIYLFIISIVLSLVLASGIMFSWSIGLISPMSANRTLPTRIFTVVAWLIGGAIMAVWGVVSTTDIPVLIWVMLSGGLICVTLIIAINEREEWSPRITRTIPRFPLWRIPLFLLYTGSGGGVLFCVVLSVLTAVAACAWRLYHGMPLTVPGLPSAFDAFEIMGKTTAICVLYFYCYCMTAVFCRNTFLNSWIGREYTWVVALTLFIGVSVGPFLVAFVILQGRWDYNEHFYILLGNPFVAAFEISEVDHYGGYHERNVLFFTIAIGWTMLVSVLNMPWLIQQMIRFHPPKTRKAAGDEAAQLPPEVAVVEPALPVVTPLPPATEGASTGVQDLSAMS